MQGFSRAAALDPTNTDYRLAAAVARSHAVTALIQAAAKDRLLGNDAAARAALARALALDPGNFEANQHLDELADDAAREQSKPLYEQTSSEIEAAEPLEPVSRRAQLPHAQRSTPGDPAGFQSIRADGDAR